MAAPTTRLVMAAGVAAALNLSLVGPVTSAVSAPTATLHDSAAAAGKTGKLKVKLIGLPDPVKAVKVKGPRKFKASLAKTTKLKKLRPGKYQVKAKKQVSNEFTSYRPVTRKQSVRVRPGKTAKVKVVFKDVFDDGNAREEPIVVAPPSSPPPTPNTPAPGPSAPPPQVPGNPPATTPPTSPPATTPIDDPPVNGAPLRALAAGSAHTCAIRDSGDVWCWGSNQYGQLGDGTTANSASPRQVPGLTDAVAIDTGTATTCAVLATGQARCWGSNSSGQLGDGRVSSGSSPADSTTPVAVTDAQGDPLDSITGITVGTNHACAVRDEGGSRTSVWCWGANNLGQLGLGQLPLDQAGADQPRAVEVTKARPRPSAVSAGSGFTCTLLGNGRVECWGTNDFGQLGDATAAQSDTPKTVELGQRGATAVDAGDDHACALLGDGTASCWGQNDQGQLNGAAGSPRDTSAIPPVNVAVTGFSRIAAGGLHTCAIAGASEVRCWGGNFAGQLGIGSTTDTAGIASVPGLTGVELLASGANHSCAATDRGAVFCWGDNDSGQAGPGGGQEVTAPRLVSFP